MNSLLFRIAWRLAVYPAVIFLVLSFGVFWLYSHPRRNVSGISPRSAGLFEEPVKLMTQDGVELDAWFIPHETSRKAVIVCHGYPMDKGDVLGLTSYLAKDYSLLYFDFRATGRSGGFFSTGGAREVLDIDAAVKFLEGRGMESIGIFGFSMGAASALLSDNPGIKARVLDSPFATLSGELDWIFSGWRFLRRPMLFMMKAWSFIVTGINISAVNPAENRSAFGAPMLLIHGDADEVVPHYNSLAIKAANPKAELWLIEGANHGETRYKSLAEYEKRVRDFFNASL